MNKDAHSASAAEKKILIPHYFKELDYKILSEKYEVDRFYFYYNQVCVIKLFWKIKNYDLNYSWFGNIWAAFAVIFSIFWRKKSIVIA